MIRKREEQEIRGGPERREHKWIAANERQQRKHSDRDKAVHKHID